MARLRSRGGARREINLPPVPYILCWLLTGQDADEFLAGAPHGPVQLLAGRKGGAPSLLAPTQQVAAD